MGSLLLQSSTVSGGKGVSGLRSQCRGIVRAGGPAGPLSIVPQVVKQEEGHIETVKISLAVNPVPGGVPTPIRRDHLSNSWQSPTSTWVPSHQYQGGSDNRILLPPLLACTASPPGYR